MWFLDGSLCGFHMIVWWFYSQLFKRLGFFLVVLGWFHGRLGCLSTPTSTCPLQISSCRNRQCNAWSSKTPQEPKWKFMKTAWIWEEYLLSFWANGFDSLGLAVFQKTSRWVQTSSCWAGGFWCPTGLPLWAQHLILHAKSNPGGARQMSFWGTAREPPHQTKASRSPNKPFTKHQAAHLRYFWGKCWRYLFTQNVSPSYKQLKLYISKPASPKKILRRCPKQKRNRSNNLTPPRENPQRTIESPKTI